MLQHPATRPLGHHVVCGIRCVWDCRPVVRLVADPRNESENVGLLMLGVS